MHINSQTRLLTLILFLSSVFITALAATAPSPSPAPAKDENSSEDINTKLENLDPTQPLDYFLLAEDVDYEAQTPEEDQLALRLYFLAMQLDLRNGGQTALARSACIAMAGLTNDPKLKLQLKALQELYNPSHPAFRPSDNTGPYNTLPRDADETIDNALEGLSLYRLGEGRAAISRLDNDDIKKLLAPYEAATGHMDEILGWCRRNPTCRECNNHRIIEARSGLTGIVEPTICPTCKGHPGPELNDDRLNDMLIMEIALRTEKLDKWSVQLALEGGRPLQPLDPDSLAGKLNMDPLATIYRNGQWVQPPGKSLK